MIIKFSPQKYKNSKSNDELPLECKYCKKIFFKKKRYITQIKNKIKSKNLTINSCCYCSRVCHNNDKNKRKLCSCKQCNKKFHKAADQIKKTKNHFCSQSCAATYNNTHKKHGTRKSKLEKWLEQKLPKLYPDLEFHFNRKDAINSELDIYIPKLKLAFELNGIFHYEPIFGKKKLAQIQNNDNRKFQACLDEKIELCIIDASSLTYFKPLKAIKYLNIICKIIDSK